MNRFLPVALATILITIVPTIASAHIIAWRAGESRTIGFGHCAKGACTKRVYWGASKPHRHVRGKVVFERIVSRLNDH
ncbi:MAG: hypothetical protein CTY31_14005 [Hyphomicrobium sp.]|nr:MAG: hypothetical protein CTY31_14005 [Hyphomicrobium sp.]